MNPMETQSALPTITIFGTKVQGFTVPQLKAYIAQVIRQGGKARILHANVHGLNLAHGDARMQRALNAAEVVFCDGAGVVLGAKILGVQLPPRITYADWGWTLAEFARDEGFSIYLLGSKPGVAEAAAAQLQARYPGVQIAGTDHGYFEKVPTSAENQAVIARVNAVRPDILLVGFGMPVQEYWIDENWQALDARTIFSVGAAIDYLSGQLARGPRLLTSNGFEWLARLIIEPRRLWRRYILGNPLFLWRVVRQRFGL